MNKVIYKLLIMLLLSNISINANAEGKTSMGVPPCGKWVASKEEKDDGLARLVYTSWLAGYLSGLAAGTGIDILKNKQDAKSIYLWVDNYCNANPLSDVYEAGNALFYELEKRQK